MFINNWYNLGIDRDNIDSNIKGGRIMFELMPFDMGRRGLRNFFDEFDKRLFKDGDISIFRADILDKGDKFVLEAELPGFKKDDIKIDLDDELLTISAQHEENSKDEDKENGEYYIHKERRFGSYSRSFHVSNIDTDKIEASYDNGILTLELPKKEPEASPTKKIEIK